MENKEEEEDHFKKDMKYSDLELLYGKDCKDNPHKEISQTFVDWFSPGGGHEKRIEALSAFCDLIRKAAEEQGVEIPETSRFRICGPPDRKDK